MAPGSGQDGGTEAGFHLLSRPSSSSTAPFDYSADSLSDEFYDDHEYKQSSRFTSRRARIKRSLQNLSTKPLFWHTRRKFKGRIPRLLIFSLNISLIWFIIACIWSSADAVFRPSYSNPPAHYRQLEERIKGSDLPGRGNTRGEKVFIASNIIQADMIKGVWGENLLRLIDYLGPENVFVSIYENDSGPETTAALSWLRDQLRCNHSVVFGDHIPLTGFPTIILPSTGQAAVKRLTYLTEVRNRMMLPLDPPPALSLPQYAFNHTITRFDKLLFLNDIYYDPIDALHLLFSTNYNSASNRSEFLGACAMDFIRGGTLYDSFVVRDVDGNEITWFTYPWFTPFGSGVTRNDVLSQTDAVRVKSCWSGMAAYDATPFLRGDVLASTALDPVESAHLAQSTGGAKSWAQRRNLNDVAESAVQSNGGEAEDSEDHFDLQLPLYPPLRFRHEKELFWEASECCLLNADLLARHPSANSGSDTGIYLNPYIRVAYAPSTFYAWQPFLQRFERGLALMQLVFAHIGIKQEYNPRRLETPGYTSTRRVWEFDRPDLTNEERNNTMLSLPLAEEDRAGKWVNKPVEKVLPGGFCGQRRLFVMLGDLEEANRNGVGKNWVKIPTPSGY